MQPIQANMEPIPGYRLISRLGRGGCGEVWKAEAPGGIPKAIKFVEGDLDGFQPGAAEQEQKSLHRVKGIRHPFVLSIERFDVIDGQLIIVMELADKNLHERYSEYVARGLPGIPREELLRYMEEAAEALDLMSTQHDLQHLDIKPQNIFLVHQHVKVADFGLTKDLQGARAALTGGMTPTYAPPETFDGWVSRQTDQYSLAIVYQEMLTGRRPFGGTNTRQLIMQHLSAPPDLSALPAEDRAAVGRALAKTPEERFLSCADFVRALQLATAAPTRSSANPDHSPAVTKSKSEVVARPSGPAEMPGRRTATSPALARPVRRPAAATGYNSRPNGPDRDPEGILFPALVIGIGGTGCAALRHFRELIHDRFGRPTVPHLRWLLIDTDPNAIEAAQAGPASSALLPNEVLLVSPGLPAAYEDRTELSTDTRFTADTQGRLSATPAAHGAQGLGRLALGDHSSAVRDRIRAALAAFAAPDFLAEADRMTGLGVRSSSPRVYIAASVAGATGSGMLIDLAFLVRRMLRGLQLSAEHLVGLLSLPGLAPGPASANARRTLEKLGYHDRLDTVYEAPLDAAGDRADAGRPFRRCALLAPSTAPALAAHLMFTETLTPVGRVLHPDRTAIPEIPYSIVGLRRVLWPRDRLLAAVARRLARDTLAGWVGPAASGMVETVTQVVDREWTERRLDVALLRTGIEYGASQKLGGAIDSLVQEILPAASGGPGTAGPDVITAGTALDRLTELMGAADTNEPEKNGRVATALEMRAADLAIAADARLVSLIVSLVEKPGQRVAAAIEAVRIFGERLRAVMAALDRELAGLTDESSAGFAGLRDVLAVPVLTGKSVMRRPTVPPDFSVRAAQWAKTRYRQLRDRAVAGVYRRLLATIPQLERELLLVTNGLTALTRELSIPTESVLPSDGVCAYLFPYGAQSFEEAADKVADAFGDGVPREFDELVQSKLRAAGRGIIQVAVRPEESGPRLIRVLRAEAERFVEVRANKLSISQALLKHFTDRDDLQGYLRGLVESAAPAGGPVGGPPPLTVVGLPDDSASQQVGDLLRKLAGDGQVLEARAADELIVLQEYRGISLATLLDCPTAIRPSEPPGVPLAADVMSPSSCG